MVGNTAVGGAHKHYSFSSKGTGRLERNQTEG